MRDFIACMTSVFLIVCPWYEVFLAEEHLGHAIAALIFRSEIVGSYAWEGTQKFVYRLAQGSGTSSMYYLHAFGAGKQGPVEELFKFCQS